MPFDQDLRRTLDGIADRLREELARQLDQAANELQASADADRAGAMNEAVQAALEAAEGDTDLRVQAAVADMQTAIANAEAAARESALAEGRAAGLEEGREAGLREGREAGQKDASSTSAPGEGNADQLAAAVRMMNASRSLSEVLDTLAIAAGREAPRVGVLLVQGDTLRGWRFIGFGPAFDEASGVELSLDDAGLITEAVQRGETQVAGGGSPAGDAQAPAFAALPSARRSVAVPIAIGGQAIAVLYADQGNAEAADETALVWAASLEILAMHAARSLEAITALRSAQVLAGTRMVPGASAAGHASSADTPRVGKDEDDPESARRYARLLVSEIRLYHESTVMAGRRERDLAKRLGGEIARARMLYEQRVPANLRGTADYFQAELVRTLANGDASLLG